MSAIEDQARSLFLAALERSADQWPAFLDEACADNAELRARIEQLLHAHQALGSIHGGAAERIATVDDPSAGEHAGTVIGPYKLLEQIGEGGFGVVYLAEQTEPVRRKVALKILKPGMDTRQVVARFEAERQALAIMDHPNIARVFDGGATPSGRPYFVMELVKGLPITDFCDQNHLTPRQRLELFVPVCQAVQHAHQKGIIHRDLKPSNVLVSRHDTTPMVKVIDFGVAKALGQELTDKTLFTGIAQMIGTPLYMSPEQAGMSDLDVDTRSDIYSLGVLLYELLTGTTPFTKEQFKQAAYDEIRRIIREEEPPRPSTRLSESKDSLPSISAQRQTEPAKLTKLVRGELDWIVMKALEKDRNRRYDSATALAADLQRYLGDEPVLAGPPSANYRLRKWLRRNKGPVLAAMLLLVSLLAGSIVSLYFAFQERYQARQATAAARRAQEKEELATRKEREARENETQAKRAASVARHNQYIAEMSWAPHYLREGKIARLKELLAKQPKDLRGWEWHYRWRLCHQELRTLKGHSELPLLSRKDYWPRELGPAQPDAFYIPGAQSPEFSPDGRWLAAVGGYTLGRKKRDVGELFLWDLSLPDADQEPRRLRGLSEGGQVERVRFSPDGKTLASVGDDGVRLWEVPSGQLLHSFSTGTGEISFSRDGRRLALATNPVVPGGNAPAVLNPLAVIPGAVAVWDVASGKELHTWSTGATSFLAFHPEGTLLTVDPSAIRLWEAATGKELHSIKHNTKGHDGTIHAALSADGTQVALASEDGVRLRDLVTGRPRCLLKGHTAAEVNNLAFSPDGRQLASAGRDGMIKIWNIRDRMSPLDPGVPPTAMFRALEGGYERTVTGVAFSPDGLWLASSGDDGLIRIWDAHASGQEMRDFDGRKGIPWDEEALSVPDPWETISIEEQERLDRHHMKVDKQNRRDGGVECLAWSPDGRRLASGGRDEVVRLWDAKDRELLQTFKGHLASVCAVAFSPGPGEGGLAQRIVSVSEDGTIKVWAVAAGNELHTARVNLREICDVAFSPDGRWLAFAGEEEREGGESRVRLWDVCHPGGPREIHALTGHSGDTISAVAFSPDGRRLASACENEIKLWDMATRQELCSLPLFGGVEELAFSPDGWRLIGDARVWDARPLLTPEMAVEREATALLDALLARPLSCKDVVEHLRNHPALSEPVRQRALARMAHYWEVKDPQRYAGAARAVARQPHLPAFWYRQALSQAEAVCTQAPENGAFLTALGMAQYRLGMYQEALRTLTRAERLNAKAPAVRVPGAGADLALLALTHHQLGQADEAQAHLTRLRQRMQDVGWRNDSENQALLREAERQIEGTLLP